MEKSKYDAMVSSIQSLIDKDELNEALSVHRQNERRGMLQHLVRDAFEKSPMAMYNGGYKYFTGRYYESVEWDEFGNVVYDIMRGIGVPPGDMLSLESVTRVCRRAVSVKHLRVNNSLVTFKNCVVDVSTGETMDFSPKYVSFSAVDYDYDPKAKGYRWKLFLDEVLPRATYQEILQEFVGALYIDRKEAKIEKLLILKGSGANGKSVVFETLMGLIGRNNVSNFALDELLGSGSERKRNVATMNGKRLNYASETQRFTVDGSSGALKALISGEPMEARAMYGDNFTAYDIPLIFINTNQMPVIKDWSHGMRRRITILPFDVEIPKWRQDVTLSATLRAEYPAIFNWAMDGRARFVRNGYKFTENRLLETMMEEYHSESSSLLRFMKRRGYLREDPDLKDGKPMWIRYTDLYEEYSRWCVAENEERVARNQGGRILQEAGFKYRRSTDGRQYGVFGAQAISRATKILLYSRAAAEFNAAKKSEKHIDQRKVKRIGDKLMTEYGWTRCAVGFTELQEYLGYTFDFSRHLASGKLDGCYQVEEGLYFFDLDAIDEKWRPAYEDGIKSRLERKYLNSDYDKLMDSLTETD